jgi:hypothetical protein
VTARGAPRLFAIFSLGALVCVFASVFVGGAALGAFGVVSPMLQVLTAPDVLPRLPYLVAVAVAAISVWMVTRPSTGGARSA